MEDFNIKQFLIENKMTRNSRLLNENNPVTNPNTYGFPDEYKKKLETLFPDSQVDSDHYEFWGFDSEKELEDVLDDEYDEFSKERIEGGVTSAMEEMFPKYDVEVNFMYGGDEKMSVSIKHKNDKDNFFIFDLDNNLT
jgi:hypothetical protein